MRFYNILEAKETIMLVDLPYNENELHPVMSKETVHYHYHVLSKKYVDNFNNKMGDLEFNRAGALLHNLFWAQLMPPKFNNQPKNSILKFIEDKHNDWIDFRDMFIDVGIKFKGSGWVYLSMTGDIKTLENQTWAEDILLPIDIWEHSYYLDYPANKAQYLRNIWRCINWNVIDDRLTVRS